MRYCIILGLLVGCGFNGNQRLTTQGKTNHEISLSLPYIKEIKELCLELYPDDRKLYAQCSLDNLNLFSLDLSGSIDAACGDDIENVPIELQDFCKKD